MSDKNSAVREHLAATAQYQVSKNCFQFGCLSVKIDPDSPLKGVEFEETIRVSIYDPETNCDLTFFATIDKVDIISDAL